MKLRSIIITAALSAICGSACTGLRDTGVAYQVVDRPDRSEILIYLNNLTENEICVGVSNWPDDEGRIQSYAYLSIEVDRVAYSQRELGHSDCFDFANEGLCSHRLRPGDQLIGRLPYENFDLPEELYESQKVLRFFPAYEFSDVECRPID
jgi:hypothetical protein